VAALGARLALGGSEASSARARTEQIVIEAQPIAAFDKMDPAKTRFGKLTWRGGLVLTSPSVRFGGWSGLEIDAQGQSLLAVSDGGAWMRAELVYDKDRPVALASARLGPLRARSGRVLLKKRQVDAEGLTFVKGTPAKGAVLISFERNHRIGHFDVDAKGLKAPRSYLKLPKAARQLSGNRGIEAIAILRGGPYEGSLVAIAERLKDAAGDHTGWLWVKGKPHVIHLTDSDEYDITDATALPDGGLLVLERRFRWGEGVKTRLRLVRQRELHPGARIAGEVLLDANMNNEIDNMEGLAAHAGAGGQIIVTMISDDNFNRGLQRTVLLQFVLDGADLARSDAQP